MKKRIAVFFGGRSPEHDVSIVSGLQALEAIDSARYDAFPVYVAPDGRWLCGEALRSRQSYMISGDMRARLQEVTLDTAPQPGMGGRLLPVGARWPWSAKALDFDVALPVFHGLNGEDGSIQGLFELAGVAYTGMRQTASAVFMNKVMTKELLSSAGIPVLPHVVLRRPAQGYGMDAAYVQAALKQAEIVFPCILKPVHLGSSIGVAKVQSLEEVRACLPAIFEYDDAAMLEPFVPHLVEYNIAVCALGGDVRTSAIERPKAAAELLDFKQKYLSGGGKSGQKGGTKTPGESSQGMLSLTRELNPALAEEQENNIRHWATRLFVMTEGSGAPRIDFISNGATGQVWLNEVNPCPGSLGYFLWESSRQNPMLFAELLDGLIEEAITLRRGRALPRDPVPQDARLLPRRG